MTIFFARIQQNWCDGLLIHKLLNSEGKFKEKEFIPCTAKPLEMEITPFQNTIGKNVLQLIIKTDSKNILSSTIKLKLILDLFN